MAKQAETVFKEKVQRKLKTVPNLWFSKIQQVAIRGTPDILICYCGRFFAWELKVGKGKASGLQEFNLARISEASGVARVVTPENFDECWSELMQERTKHNVRKDGQHDHP